MFVIVYFVFWVAYVDWRILAYICVVAWPDVSSIKLRVRTTLEVKICLKWHI